MNEVLFDTSKLRGRIVEKFGSQGRFARAVGRSEPFVSSVLSGRSFLEQRDIVNWQGHLDIPDSDLGAYFFVRKVHDIEL